MLQRAFKVVTQDRQAVMCSKKWATVAVVNSLFRVYFKVRHNAAWPAHSHADRRCVVPLLQMNSLRNARPLVTMVTRLTEAPGTQYPLAAFPPSQTVRGGRSVQSAVVAAC